MLTPKPDKKSGKKVQSSKKYITTNIFCYTIIDLMKKTRTEVIALCQKTTKSEMNIMDIQRRFNIEDKCKGFIFKVRFPHRFVCPYCLFDITVMKVPGVVSICRALLVPQMLVHPFFKHLLVASTKIL